MTAPDPRLEEIEGRLSKATPGPWGAYAGCIRQDRSWRDESEIVLDYDGDRPSIQNAVFIAAAPADIAYLLAELRKAQDKLARVEAVHEPIDAMMYSGSQQRIVKVCTGCGTDGGNWQRWPCPTIRAAVADATGGERG